MINTTSFVNAIEKVKHQLRINFDLRTEQMMDFQLWQAERKIVFVFCSTHRIR